MSTLIHPQLEQALAPGSTVDPLNVFLKLNLPSTAKTPEQRAWHAASLIHRVEQYVRGPNKFQYHDLADLLQVKASPDFLRQLIAEPEVRAASTSPDFDSAKIEPVRRREVSIEAINREFKKPRGTTSRGSR